MPNPNKQDILNLGKVLQGLMNDYSQGQVMQGYEDQVGQAELSSRGGSFQRPMPGGPPATMSYVGGQPNAPLDKLGFLRKLMELSTTNPLAGRRLGNELDFEKATDPSYQFMETSAGVLKITKPPFGGEPTIKNAFPFEAKPAMTPFQEASLKLREKSLGRGSSTDLRAIANSRGTLKASHSIIESFESNPELMANYQKIVKDPQVVEATNAGDVDLAQTIMARLLGDTTPQKVIAKRYMDYIKAQRDEVDESEFLQRMGEKNIPTRKKKAQTAIPIEY